MGKTSSEVKRRYNKKAYDSIQVMLPKGYKDIIKKRAAELGVSMAAHIKELVDKDIGQSKNAGQKDIEI